MISVLLFFITISFCFFNWIWKRKEKKVLEPPNLAGYLPVLGHIFRLMGDSKFLYKSVKEVSDEMLQKRQDVAKLYIGPRLNYVITDADDCALVANSCLDKDYYYDFAKPFVKNGLIIADVPLWKQHRKLLNPAFRQQDLNKFFDLFNNQAKILVKKLRKEIGHAFNHEEYVGVHNLESLCFSAFGADIKELGGLHKNYLEGFSHVLNIFAERFQKCWLHFEFIYNFTQLKKKQDTVIARMEEFTYTVFKKKKAEMAENKQYCKKLGQFMPLMDIVIEASKEGQLYTDADILSEMNSIVGGGFDTTTCTLTVALMLLGSYHDVQRRAYDEIQEVFQNTDRDVDKDDLPKLKYIEGLLKETMRLYPVVPMVSRYLTKDVQLKNYTLKAGNGVMMFFIALHRHPAWGPDADVFKPERWLDSSTLPSNPSYFAGFSLGKRACIGKTYAMMSMKILLVHLLRNYTIKSDITKMELKMDAFARPACGQYIEIERRTN